MNLFLFLIGCVLWVKPQESKPVFEIRYRPIEAQTEEGKKLIRQVPGAQWDEGLHKAALLLTSKLRSRSARIPTDVASDATAITGFPGQARFAKLINGGAFPDELVEAIQTDMRGKPVDVCLVSRKYGDGIVLWLAGWAPHLMEIDPIPRNISLDAAIPIHVELEGTDRATLYVSYPDGGVDAMPIMPLADRWLNNFYIPGEYRFEVVADRISGPQVALLFSVFVDVPTPNLPSLNKKNATVQSPIEAERFLYRAVNKLREEQGLQPLKRFTLFEPLAREHSAWMAVTGVIDHKIPNVTPGVPHHAANLAHPRARHYQNVAAAFSGQEALSLSLDSPGHFKTLLCETCTHMSIGVALEPKRTGTPRLFFTWEVLEFPQGRPMKIDKLQQE